MNGSESDVQSQQDTIVIMRKEMTEYLKTKQLDHESDPLEWWHSNASAYPHAARAAKIVMSIPASSAPVKRIFSMAGKIFRPERIRMKVEKFESLMFIKCKKDVC